MGLSERIREINADRQLDIEDLLEYVRNKTLKEHLKLDIEKTKKAVRTYVYEYFSERYPYLLSEAYKYYDTVYNRLFGLGPIEKHLQNPNVTDIYVLGTDIVYIENGVKKEDPETFIDDSEVRKVIDRIAAQVGKTVNIAVPHADAELYDGSRALLVIPPEIERPIIIIRKHTASAKRLEELTDGMKNLKEMIPYFKTAVKERKNFIVIGQTGAGKTTLINALAFEIQPKHVVAVLEDTRELQLPLKYVYYFKTREGTEDVKPITWSDILRNCLRANPNRIILTEIRTPAAAYEFINVLNSGHQGSMTTIHASGVLLGLQRLEMLIKEYKNMDDISLRKLITNAVDTIVFLDILEDEKGDNIGRIIKELAEVKGLNPDGTYNLEYIIQDGKILKN